MRRLAALAVIAVLAAAGLVVSVDRQAQAHGAETFPGSRQYFCWLDGTTETGNIVPQNPACADAVAASGTTPLYNWFGNLDSNAAGRTVGYIPDGRICDGGGNGPYDFSPYNAMRDDWPTTHLTAGDTYEFQHNNWAAHPGRFDVYLTREGWEPTAPLAWDALELIDSVVDPPASGGPGGLNYYYWDVTLPQDRTGQHLVFTHWVRSDSAENFYSCSDVVFDGGDGEVTGIGDGSGPVDPPDACPDEAPGVPGAPMASSVTATSAHVMWGLVTGCATAYEVLDVADGEVIATSEGAPPSPMVDLTGLDPGTTYEVAVQARNDHTDEVSAVGPSVTFTTLEEDGPPADPAGTCTVAYSAPHWGDQTGYTATVTLTNTSEVALDGWELTWQYPAGHTVTAPGWGGVVAQEGTTVTATDAPWNAALAPGDSATFGYNAQAATTGSHPAPVTFTLDGHPCTT